MKAASRHIIAQSRWPVGSTSEIERFQPVPDAMFTIAAARQAYDRGTIEMCQGREEIVEAGRCMVVLSLYAIPRKTPRRVDRPTFGRGNAGWR